MLLLTASAAAASTIPVTTRLDDGAPGLASNCTGSAAVTDCSLRDAIAFANAPANAGTTIDVPAGVYDLTGTELQITAPVTINSQGPSPSGADIVQQAGSGARVLEITAPAGAVSISGVEITGGATIAAGGGIYAVGASLTLVNSTVTGNTASSGGGIDMQSGGETGTILTLTGDTIDANSASGSASNVASQEPVDAGATIIAAPGGDAARNCVLTGTPTETDSSPNLEDDPAGSCGFKAASGDLVGVAPDLAPLASNGGPTQTMLPNPGSPVIGAVGTCPSSLLTDQRGDPRPAGGPCDIGAVQIQPPGSVNAPSLSPAQPSYGQTLTCDAGTWSGDGSLADAYAWLRDGAAIAGASGSAYPVQLADVGHRIACRVTATSSYARQGNALQAAATSGSVVVSAPAPTVTISAPSSRATYLLGAPLDATYTCADVGGPGLASCVGTTADGAPLPTSTAGRHTLTVTATDQAAQAITRSSTYTVVVAALSRVREAHARWRTSGKPARNKPPVGTSFTFTLNIASPVTLGFTGHVSGRLVHGRCVAPAPASAGKSSHTKPSPLCTRVITAGPLTLSGARGVNTIAFSGRLSSAGAPLAAGAYTVTIALAGASAAVSKPVTLAFTITA